MSHLHVDRPAQGVLRLTLNRPEARNAYSVEMIDDLMLALDAAEDDAATRCLILTGAGPAFSAGGDLKLMQARQGMFEGEAPTLRLRYIQHIHRVPRRLARFDKPVVAAINGAAIGAGLDLACMCDLRVAADTAKLGSTFVSVGLIPGDGGAYLLARTVGFPKALEMILTARVLSAQEALAIGLVNQVVPAASLEAEAVAVAVALAKQPPTALQLAKRAAYSAWDASLHAALEQAATYQAIAQTSPEHAAQLLAMMKPPAP